MRASLLARLLSGLQPDRRSVQQDQGYGAPSRSAHEGGFGGGVGRSAFGAQRSGRSRVFRACWLLCTSPTTVKRAVETTGTLGTLALGLPLESVHLFGRA